MSPKNLNVIKIPKILKEKLSNGYDLATLASDVRIYAEGLSNKIKEARSKNSNI